MPPARGLGVPIPAKRSPPIVRGRANPLRVRVPEVEPGAVVAASAPTEGSRIAVVARWRDPNAAEPRVKGRVAPGDLSCRAHAEKIHTVRAYCRRGWPSRQSAWGVGLSGPTGMPRFGRTTCVNDPTLITSSRRFEGRRPVEIVYGSGSGYMRCTCLAPLQSRSRKSIKRMRRLHRSSSGA